MSRVIKFNLTNGRPLFKYSLLVLSFTIAVLVDGGFANQRPAQASDSGVLSHSNEEADKSSKFRLLSSKISINKNGRNENTREKEREDNESKYHTRKDGPGDAGKNTLGDTAQTISESDEQNEDGITSSQPNPSEHVYIACESEDPNQPLCLTPTPTKNPLEISCSASGGSWQVYPSSCVDQCSLVTNPYLVCTDTVTASCVCGPESCWNGESCVPNPVAVSPTPTPTPNPTAAIYPIICGGDECPGDPVKPTDPICAPCKDSRLNCPMICLTEDNI